MEKMAEFVRHMTEDLRGKVYLMVGRAILEAVNDRGAIQTAQIRLLDGEVQDDVERVQQYGLTSNPHPTAESVVVSVGGNRDHGLIIAVEDREFRLVGLEGGEVALYDDLKQKVHLTRKGIVVEGAGLPMLFTKTPEITLDSKVRITKSLQVDESVNADVDIVAGRDVKDQGGSKSMSGMRSNFDEHDHDETGSVTSRPRKGM